MKRASSAGPALPLTRSARPSPGPLALRAPDATVAVVVVPSPAQERLPADTRAAGQDAKVEPHVRVVAGRELAYCVSVTRALPPLLARAVPVEQDQIAPIPVVELER